MGRTLFGIIVWLFVLVLSAFAHPGRLDGQGGHRTNNQWLYDGEYIEIENNIPYLEKGTLIFEPGGYHFHCKPSTNKIDLFTYRDGIYLISPQVKANITSNIKVSNENVVASKNSELYHNPDCKYVKNIKEENIVIFEDKEDAEKSDYKAHKCEVSND